MPRGSLERWSPEVRPQISLTEDLRESSFGHLRLISGGGRRGLGEASDQIEQRPLDLEGGLST